MRLSTSTNIVSFLPDKMQKNNFDFCIELCAKAGYTALDINLCEAMNPDSKMRTNDWENYVKEIAEMGRRHGIIFSQSHLPYYDVFGSKDIEKNRLMEELIRRCIIASAELGVKWTVTHPVTYYDAGPHTSITLEKNLEYFSVHFDTAKKAGVGIALENVFEYRGAHNQRAFGSSVIELCELTDALSKIYCVPGTLPKDNELVGVCYDFGHANLCGGFHRENLRIIGSRLKATHVQDNFYKSDDHFMPFFGLTDWADAMAGLVEIGYEGDLCYEIQEFGRYLPNELKHLTVELSIKIGNYLLDMAAKSR